MAGGLGLGNRHRAWFQVEESLRVSTPGGSDVAPAPQGRVKPVFGPRGRTSARSLVVTEPAYRPAHSHLPAFGRLGPQSKGHHGRHAEDAS